MSEPARPAAVNAAQPHSRTETPPGATNGDQMAPCATDSLEAAQIEESEGGVMSLTSDEYASLNRCDCGHSANSHNSGGCLSSQCGCLRFPSEAREMAVEALLAVREKAAAVKALRDARIQWQSSDWANAPRREDRVVERIANAQFVTDWLRARANRIEAGE